jgi:ATP-binding cassette subfamily B protein
MFKLFARSVKEQTRLAPSVLPFGFLSALFEAAHPFVNIVFTAKIIGELMGGKDKAMLLTYAVLTVALNCILYILKEAFFSFFINTCYPKLYFAEQNKAGAKLFSVDYEKLEDKTFDEKTRKYQDSLKTKGSHFHAFAWTLRGIFSGLISFGAAIFVLIPLFKISFVRTGDGFLQSPYFALVVFGGIGALIVMVFFLNKQTQKAYFHLQDQYLNLSRIFDYYMGVVTDYKNGKEIRIFSEQKLIERDAAYHLIEKGVKIRKKVANATGMSTSVIAVIGAMAGFGVYAFIGLKGLGKAFSIDALVMYTGSFMIIVSSLTEIFSNIGNFSNILRTVGYYFDIIDTDNQRAGSLSADGIGTDGLVIEFKNVGFKYPGSDAYALKDLNITLGDGERLAIVGQNGSGKTTFIKLLTKMYDNYEGDILVNGVNIREYDTDGYRKLFAVVFQDFKIFSFTAADNVACGGEADGAKIMKCLDDAGIGERIRKMPNGANTYLYKDCEEKGVEISGGESQKLALSRALYKDAPFIILDEPTASLDPVAEYELYSKFNDLVKDKTAVYISHRLSSCRFCGKIAVFDKGRLVQYGTHDALIKDREEKYYELWQAQAQYYV